MSKILVVIDMQNDFIDGVLGTKEATEIVDKVTQKIKEHDGTILFTRDTHDDLYLQTQEGKNLPVVHCIYNSKGWELVPSVKQLAEERNCKIFDKTTFGSPQLAHYAALICAEEEIECIELIGVCTDICVISNALLLKSIIPEIPIYVNASYCAGVTPETHRTALEAMKMCQIQIID
ncbi:cysteine hydrolase family protein [Anaerosacchariphilus polymeriproducens]|uniref:Cysteine hydrolase n=1 Tax=Anaerosacchariphilus polymeriproducens TaxID=1812858 RepID=A0A371AWG3_9FIRM|nr:isochorismatase family cysteine hydrolase [Anaerosacchariphilus polymeriproducens]RDU23872.1 cysteine hydrolase [Anaerosacchariphilus polymeriproducens]